MTRGLDQYIGGLCALPATRKDSEHAHPKLAWRFRGRARTYILKRGMARHVMKRDSVVRIVMYDVKIATSKKTGSKTFVHAEETHRVELEDSIDHESNRSGFDDLVAMMSSSYIFFAHVNGDVSIVLPRTGVVLKTLSAAHDPKSLASTGSVNFVVADRAYLSASKCVQMTLQSACFPGGKRLASCWSIASPLVWTPQTHHLFPKTFATLRKPSCCAALDSVVIRRILPARASFRLLLKRQHAAMNENRLRRRKDIDASFSINGKGV